MGNPGEVRGPGEMEDVRGGREVRRRWEVGVESGGDWGKYEGGGESARVRGLDDRRRYNEPN